MSRVSRMLQPDEHTKRIRPDETMTQEAWLDYCQMRYDNLIMALRYYDDQLVKHGRKSRHILPRRVNHP